MSLNPFGPGKFEKLNFWDSKISLDVNVNNWRTTSGKCINQVFIRKITEHSFQNVLLKVQFILTLFEILLFEGWSMLSLAAGYGEKELSFR